MFNKFLKVAIATSHFIKEVYNGDFYQSLAFQSSRQFKIMYRKLEKKKAKLAGKYKWAWDMKSFLNKTLNFLFRKFWAS